MHKEIVCTNHSVKNIVGIIGGQTSEVSLEIARLGRIFRVPQVRCDTFINRKATSILQSCSYLSTAVVLSDKELFPYFFRTVPSDTFQAKAMVEVIKEFGWNYVSVVHTETDYGTTGYEALLKHAEKEKTLCLADPLVIHDDNYEFVIDKLEANPMTKVVVVFADRKPAGQLLEAAKKRKAFSFLWVGSDAWVSREGLCAKTIFRSVRISAILQIIAGHGSLSMTACSPWCTGERRWCTGRSRCSRSGATCRASTLTSTD